MGEVIDGVRVASVGEGGGGQGLDDRLLGLVPFLLLARPQPRGYAHTMWGGGAGSGGGSKPSGDPKPWAQFGGRFGREKREGEKKGLGW